MLYTRVSSRGSLTGSVGISGPFSSLVWAARLKATSTLRAAFELACDLVGGINKTCNSRSYLPTSDSLPSTQVREQTCFGKPALHTPIHFLASMNSRSSALLVAGCCLASAQQPPLPQQPQAAASPRTSAAGLPGGLRNLENIRRKRVLTTRLEAQEARRRQEAEVADNDQQPNQQQPQQTVFSAEDADAFFAESNFFDLRHLQQNSLNTDAPTVEDTDPTTDTPAPTPVDCNSDPDVREEAVMDLLGPISPDLDDPSTPAGEAAEWILNGDPAMPDPCRDPDAVVDRFALATFYYSTGGEQWRNNDAWLSEEDACDWFGVRCDGDTIVELNMGKSSQVKEVRFAC